jgi:hypothetical protein
MAVVMMKAIAHGINPENALDNDPMVLHGLVVVAMDLVKPHGHLVILQPRNLVNLNLIHPNLIKVIEPRAGMIADRHPQVVVAVVIKGGPHGNQVNHLVIKGEPHGNQDNLPVTKVVTLVKKANLLTTKEKDQAIKAATTPLKNVILNFIF